MIRTPLAWFNLSHDRVRFALFVLGIVFAVVLMFMQLGFRGALLDSNTLVQYHLNADLVLVSPNRQLIAMREPIPRRRLTQASAVAGVARVRPLYLENGLGVMRNTNTNPARRTPSRAVRVIGLDPDAYLLSVPELDPDDPRFVGDKLQVPGTALFDRRTRADDEVPGQSVFGPLAVGTTTELAGRTITLVGSVEIGADFTTDGYLIVSTQTFADILRVPYTPGAPLADVDLGLIRLTPGADLEAVRAELKTVLAKGTDEPDVDVLTVAEYTARDQAFWLSNTPIGFAFGFGMFMGFAVGMVICYQILSGDVADHLPEYATLKAMGYRNSFLAWVVLQEALVLAVLGFVIGFGISWAAYGQVSDYTGMPLRMSVDRAVSVFVATVGMCVTSGLIALGRLLRADPADVFG
ncbi:ABC transporter permease DevC [Fimbriiglobus ruber]|uniref:DevC-like ABC transporter permease protein n=1 Tax=Fimbriiglobus ruber TaxID=1908690 RepID=A0A225D5D3_9BACT|nr:ABC transporter permease DevC [Fimbriiglobus ruber]OWK36811.1 devC-like ABC transporter permease protein [Fimbriiglobus ruber]